MLYMFLLYWNESDPPVEAQNIIGEHIEFAKDVGAAYISSTAIGGASNATTVKVRNGNAILTDGPFIESTEAMGGFYLLDCADLDEALEYAKRMPDVRNSAVEVRPVMDVPGWDYGLEDHHTRHAMG